MCKRCIKAIKDEEGRSYFAFYSRGHKLRVHADPEMAATMTDAKALEAMDICPVGSILVREKGFAVPIGQRKYDKLPIGSDVETK
jgi:[NiFe] hydrogenase diaphorase moiety small subunit